MGYKDKDLYSHWSNEAIFCYKLGCNCPKCENFYTLISAKCFMKRVVFELIKRYGAPFERNNANFIWGFDTSIETKIARGCYIKKNST